MEKLVTFILITYNQEEWVEHAVVSALNQSYKNLEIIISDDCSTDNTWSIINKIVARDQYASKKVVLNQNSKNLGITANISQALSYGSGDLFVMAAGDDVSSLDRVSIIVDQWIKFDYPAALASSLSVIDKDGLKTNDHERQLLFTYKETKLLNGLDAIKKHYFKKSNIQALGATLAYSRDVFEIFGWDMGHHQGEDQLLLGRSLLLSGCVLISDKLVDHRITGKNASYVSFEESGYQSMMNPLNLQLLYSKNELTERFIKFSRKKNLLKLQLVDLENWEVDDFMLQSFKEEFITYANFNIVLLDVRIKVIKKLTIKNLKYGFKRLGFFRTLFEIVVLRCKLCNKIMLRVTKGINVLFDKKIFTFAAK